VLAAFFVGMMTFLNLWGIRTTARTNLILLIIMSAGIGIFIVLAIHFLLAREGWRGLFSMRPFYTPKDFNLRSIATGTSLAALTYIGFDGVTTLAEEVKNPKRNVLLATVLVCLFTGIFSGLQIYLAQRVWPDYHTFTNIETAFMDVTAKVGGMALFRVMGGILIIASLGSGLTAQVGAARVLFGMGRDNYLPRKVFAHLDVKRNTPTYNLLMIAVVVFLGSLVVSYEVGAEVLNFGAFLAFMGVNLATLRYFWFTPHPGRKRRWLAAAIWLNLPRPAKMLGSLWLLVGVTYAAIHTRGFHRRPAMIDLMAINSADSPKSSALL
jgi:amino acid transporter